MRKYLVDLALIGFFALLTATGAAIKLPFLPYHPSTLQIIPVVLSGIVLGSTRGPLSQILFVFLGLMGLPLFNELAPAFPTPAIGASPLFARTGLKAGWLIGFVVASYIAGRVIEFSRGYSAAAVAAALLGSVTVTYLIGLGIPIVVLKVPLRETFFGWFWPFFLADLGKGVLVFMFIMNTRKLLSPPQTYTIL